MIIIIIITNKQVLLPALDVVGDGAVLIARRVLERGGRVLSNEILLPRIARRGTFCLIPIRGEAQKARIHKFELEKLELRNVYSF